MSGRFGPMELMLILGLVVLVFSNRLPAVLRALGRSVTEFKKGLRGGGPWAGV